MCNNKTQRKIDLYVSFLDLDTIRKHCNQSGTDVAIANAVAHREPHYGDLNGRKLVKIHLPSGFLVLEKLRVDR